MAATGRHCGSRPRQEADFRCTSQVWPRSGVGEVRELALPAIRSQSPEKRIQATGELAHALLALAALRNGSVALDEAVKLLRNAVESGEVDERTRFQLFQALGEWWEQTGDCRLLDEAKARSTAELDTSPAHAADSRLLAVCKWPSSRQRLAPITKMPRA